MEMIVHATAQAAGTEPYRKCLAMYLRNSEDSMTRESTRGPVLSII